MNWTALRTIAAPLGRDGRSGDVEESCATLCGDRLRQQSFAGSGRAEQQHTLPRLSDSTKQLRVPTTHAPAHARTHTGGHTPTPASTFPSMHVEIGAHARSNTSECRATHPLTQSLTHLIGITTASSSSRLAVSRPATSVQRTLGLAVKMSRLMSRAKSLMSGSSA